MSFKEMAKRITALEDSLQKAYELLVKAEISLMYKSHGHWQMVKQLDGTIQNELIESQDGKLFKEIKKFVDEHQPKGPTND